MAKMIPLLLAAVLATFAAARDFPRWHQLEGYTFRKWMRDAARPYAPGSAEYNRREALFNARLADIKAHNADPSKTWKRGVNQFSDWSHEEWRKYNRAGKTRKAPAPSESFPMKLGRKVTKIGDLPESVDYRTRTNPPILTGIKNQGSCGSCWAHSAVESMESYFAIKYGQLPVLSVQQIASCDYGSAGCGGGTYVSGWTAVQGFGGLNEEWTYGYQDFFAPEMEWKYTSKCQNITAKFPQIQGDNGQNFTFSWWPKANVSSWTLVPPNDAHAMMEALALHGPQAISVASDPWSDYESGILQNNYSSYASNLTWQEINHDVQMVGYGYDFGLNMNYWVVRNSWGTNYGELGYIRLYRPEHEPCGDLTGEEICGTSGVLCNPGYPDVKPLEKQNGYYF